MNTPTKTVIFTAPQGWGKTLKAKQLQKEFGCTSVVEEWWPGEPLTTGALHLCSVPPRNFRNNKPDLARIVARGWAPGT